MDTLVRRWRPYALHGVKLAVAALAIYWLTASDRLNFADLRLFLVNPAALAFTVGLWLAAVVIAALRWQLLLRALGLPVIYKQVLPLQFIAFFFNLAIPGTLGGDGARFFYMRQDLATESKTAILLSLVMDRFVGLSSLFIAGAAGIGLGLATCVWQPAQLTALLPLFGFVLTVTAGLVVALTVFLLAPAPPSQWFHGSLTHVVNKVPLLARVVAVLLVLEQYRRQPSRVAAALGLSVLLQGAVLVFYQNLTMWLTLQTPALATIGAIAPLANVLASVPLAPGGLGVGHLAFEKLFQYVGLSGGANVFNVAVLSQMTLNITGIVPYLLRRRRFGKPVSQEAATA